MIAILVQPAWVGRTADRTFREDVWLVPAANMVMRRCSTLAEPEAVLRTVPRFTWGHKHDADTSFCGRRRSDCRRRWRLVNCRPYARQY